LLDSEVAPGGENGGTLRRVVEEVGESGEDHLRGGEVAVEKVEELVDEGTSRHLTGTVGADCEEIGIISITFQVERRKADEPAILNPATFPSFPLTASLTLSNNSACLCTVSTVGGAPPAPLGVFAPLVDAEELGVGSVS
jgi:hypothetical protein